MKTHYKVFHMERKDKSRPDEIPVVAPTVAQAYDRISGGRAEWQATGSESLPYTHAPTVQAVIDALGAGWDASPAWEDNAASPFKLHGPGGVVLWFHSPAYSHQKAWSVGVEKGGQTVKGERVNVEGPDAIKISAEKAPEVIARDITRRILPAATECAARLAAALAEANEAEGGQAATASKLAAIGGHEARGATVYVGPVTFDVGYDGKTVSFKCYGVSASIAVKIAELVKVAGEE